MATAAGIDIGTHGVRIVELERRGTTLRLRRFLHLSLKDLASRGVDPEDAHALGRLIAAEAAARGINVRSGAVALGITGKDSIVRYMNVPPMPAWRLKLIMGYELNESSEKAGEKLQSDYRLVPVPRESMGELTVLMAMVKDEPVNKKLDAFQKAGVNISSVLPNSIALANAWRYLGAPSDSDGKAEIIVDLGANNAEVGLAVAGEVIFARSMVSGGEMFTERLAGTWDLPPEKAETLKRKGRGPDGEDMADALRPAFAQVGNLLKASFSFAKTQLRARKLELERVVVTGGASRTAGLEEAMGDTLDAPVVSFEPFEQIELTKDSGGDDREAASVVGREGAVAAGLAATLLRPGAFHLDLLPEAYRKRREFRHRTVWLIGAAAALLVYLGITTVHALSLKGAEAEVNQTVKSRLADVETRSEDLAELDEDNRRQVRFLGNLVARTKPAYHLAHVSALLNRELPQRVTLHELALEGDREEGAVRGSAGRTRRGRGGGESEEDDLPPPPDPYALTVRGEADDADGEARKAVRELERLLSNDAEIREAKLTNVSDDARASKVTFVLRVRFRG